MTPDTRDSPGSGGSGDEFQISHFWLVLLYLVTRVTLRRDFLFILSWNSNLKHILLRAFFEDCLPELLSKVGVLAERSMKK